jgi:ABC-type transport system substrate-binding protein
MALSGRELVAGDVQFSFDRFLTEKGNVLREALKPVDRVEVVDRYTVKFLAGGRGVDPHIPASA